MESVPRAGYKIIGLPVEGFHRRLSLANFRVLFRLLVSLNRAGKILRQFSPDAVVGVGGYASGPLLRKAASMGIPTLIQEQNSYAGVTNRLLAKRAGRICVAYEGMEKYFPAQKLVLTGNPVREEIRELRRSGNRPEARAAFKIDRDASVLLVLGGSLGARGINDAVIGKLDRILDSGVKLLWQCGTYYFEEIRHSLRAVQGGSILLHAFIQNMGQAYLASDVIIARAGAITISELSHAGRPAILIPSPNVAEDHQTKNAQSLAERSAALLIPDSEAGERMIPEALELLGDEARRNTLSENISKLAIGDSASRIAREVIDIMQA